MIVLVLKKLFHYCNLGFHTQQYWIFENSAVYAPITWSLVGKPTLSEVLANFPGDMNSEFSPNGNVEIDAMIHTLAHEVKQKLTNKSWGVGCTHSLVLTNLCNTN